MYDVVIIGSGPAGLSAAIYGKRAGLKLLVLEKNPMSGGQVLNTYEVDNYLGLPGINGFDMGMKFREHADKMGIEFVEADVIKITDKQDVKEVETNQGSYQAKALIIATGAVHAKLGVPGEEELSGMGVSYCATCDGAFFKNRTVVVVGGGDVAVEDAIFLARFCEKVYVIHRRNELRAAGILQENLFGLPNVEMLWNYEVKAIQGEDVVQAVKIQNNETGEERELPVDGVFVAVGIRPNTEVIQALVECNESGYVVAGEDGATNVPGVFVAGDLRSKPLRQIITAVADGANAATSAWAYVTK